MKYTLSVFIDAKIRLSIKHPTMKPKDITDLLGLKPNYIPFLKNCHDCIHFYRAGAKGIACKKNQFDVYSLHGCREFENRYWEYISSYKEWDPYSPALDLKTFIEEKLPDDAAWRKITKKGTVTITLSGHDNHLTFKDIKPDEKGDRKLEYSNIIEIPVELSCLLYKKKINVVFDQSFEINK